MTAYATAQRALPAYAHRYSPKKFTQHQLFACLVLKEFLKADYRGIVNILADCPNLCAAIELEHVPHYTTLQKAAGRLISVAFSNVSTTAPGPEAVHQEVLRVIAKQFPT